MNLSNTATLPVMYQIKGQSIPARLTLKQRAVFVHGLGVPSADATAVATQDRSAALACQLLSLLEATGDAPRFLLAQQAVQKWNDECDEVFLSAR